MKQYVILSIGLMVAVVNSVAIEAKAKAMQRATFAAGCFWCLEQPFDALPGVISTTSGYTGGYKMQPTYQEVSAGTTGHTEAVEVVYDSALISYERLLEVYWRNSDPTTANRQFCDVGTQYRPAIFYHSDAQREMALRSKQQIEKIKTFQDELVTEITKASTFWPAEEYHQNYYLKNPIRYKFYRYNCGRDQRLQQLWEENEHE